MSEKGYTIIGRFIYEASEKKQIEKADRFNIRPGKGLIFYGNEDNPQTPIEFDQKLISSALQKVPPGELQMIAIVNEKTGALLVTDGTKDNSIGMNEKIPQSRRTIVVTFGRISYGIIWGETEWETEESLERLIKMRLARN